MTADLSLFDTEHTTLITDYALKSIIIRLHSHLIGPYAIKTQQKVRNAPCRVVTYNGVHFLM